MRARRIIEGAAFGPEVIRTASEAFEAAWREVADRFDANTHEAVRESLAKAIISATREDSSDSDVLRGAGLRALTRSFPERFASPSAGDKAKGTGN